MSNDSTREEAIRRAEARLNVAGCNYVRDSIRTFCDVLAKYVEKQIMEDPHRREVIAPITVGEFPTVCWDQQFIDLCHPILKADLENIPNWNASERALILAYQGLHGSPAGTIERIDVD